MEAHFRVFRYFVAEIAPKLLNLKPEILVLPGQIKLLQRLPLLAHLVFLKIPCLLMIQAILLNDTSDMPGTGKINIQAAIALVLGVSRLAYIVRPCLERLDVAEEAAHIQVTSLQSVPVQLGHALAHKSAVLEQLTWSHCLAERALLLTFLWLNVVRAVELHLLYLF